MSKVFVGSLSWQVDSDALRQEFQKFGNVTDAVVILDRETRRSRGFGFVTFEDEEGSNKAIAEGNGMEVDGRRISVAQSTERQRNNDQSGGGYGRRDERNDRGYGGGGRSGGY
ncbi:RNA recognition motif domain-containing protein [Hirsutella rhossiliensis]|uniref:RNA recognition motif domain-containing protein n=1 Tax=Hirsutella rhossiliensis TaxID=111463 RepID=A0A9P8N1B4_9HYPO|nr:RNA recognition motif domain-containing protein [Hirsutella rhossiliensis]KAH0964777.1 RNA recognition motif domain-containing protein [Hirsutella rhossiliensis]